MEAASPPPPPPPFRIVSRSRTGQLFVCLSAGSDELVFDAHRLCSASLQKPEIGNFKDAQTVGLRLHAIGPHATTTVYHMTFETAVSARDALAGLGNSVFRPSSMCMSDIDGTVFLVTSTDHLASVRITQREACFRLCDSYISFSLDRDDQSQQYRRKLQEMLSAQAALEAKCESCDKALSERGGGSTWTDPELGGAARRLCYSCVADAAMQFRASASVTLKRARSLEPK